MEISLIKIGGGVLENKKELALFFEEFGKIEGPKILVHGGGRDATKLAEKLGIATKFVDGRRITDAATLNVVNMCYSAMNKRMVAELLPMGISAIGLCGADMNLLPAIRNQERGGYVGVIDTEKVNSEPLILLLEAGLVPVISPLTHDGAGQLLNTNADAVAGALAVALAKKTELKLCFAFEQQGVLLNIDDPASLLPSLNESTYAELTSSGAIHSGMKPKLDNAFAAARAGASAVIISHYLSMYSGTKITLA